MSRRRLLVGLIVLIVLWTVAAVLLRAWTTHKRVASNPNHVTILGIEQHSGDLPAKAVNDIEATTYERIKESTAQPSQYYKATIRKGSYQKTYSTSEGTYPPSQIPTVSFLVDIPGAQRTYRVRFSGGDGYAYNIVYVLCPTTGENAYQPFTCTDQQ